MNYFQSQIFSSFSKGLQKKFDIYAIEFAPVGLIYLLSRILDTRQSKIYSRYYYENEKSSINNCLNVGNVVACYFLGSVHTTPEKFEEGDYTLKTH